MICFAPVESYWTATVTVDGENVDPTLIWIGTEAPGDTPDGTCALI